MPADTLLSRGRFLTVPNMLTLLRLALVPIFLMATVRELYDVAFLVFVGAGITDAVDGYVARRFNQRSSIGAVLDPAADKIMMVSAYVMYTLLDMPWRVPGWLTFTVFSRDFLIIFFAYLLYTRVQMRRFPPSVFGKVSTVIQVTTLATTIAANTTLLAVVAVPLLQPLFILALLATLYSGFHYMRRTEQMIA